jgi:hypothetical protein
MPSTTITTKSAPAARRRALLDPKFARLLEGIPHSSRANTSRKRRRNDEDEQPRKVIVTEKARAQGTARVRSAAAPAIGMVRTFVNATAKRAQNVPLKKLVQGTVVNGVTRWVGAKLFGAWIGFCTSLVEEMDRRDEEWLEDEKLRREQLRLWKQHNHLDQQEQDTVVEETDSAPIRPADQDEDEDDHVYPKHPSGPSEEKYYMTGGAGPAGTFENGWVGSGEESESEVEAMLIEI